MPPKVLPAKGKAPAKKGKAAAESVKAVTVEASPEEVVDGREIWMATDALQKVKAMRNYFQLERDQIIVFWDITKRQLEEVRQQMRERESAKAELTERHEVEKKVFKQKIRHLLYENQLQLSSLKEEGERALVAKNDEYRQRESNALMDIRDVKWMDRELENKRREQHAALVAQQDKAIAEQQAQFEREVKEIHLKYEQMIKQLRDEMDQTRRADLRQIERREKEHLAELRDVHERTFKEIKEYYSEITSNNLETIRTLKDEVYARKRTEAHNEKAMHEVAQRNRKLTEPLAKLQRQKKELEQELSTYLADKEKQRELKAKVKEADQEYQTLSWEQEVLAQRYAKLVEDRDIILNKYNAMLQEIQRKSAFRRVLIQKKLELVQGQLEGRDAKLTEVLKRANINPEDIKVLEQKIHDLLSEKEKTVEDLQQLLVRMADKTEDVVTTYEAYLENNGVSGLAGTATLTL